MITCGGPAYSCGSHEKHSYRLTTCGAYEGCSNTCVYSHTSKSHASEPPVFYYLLPKEIDLEKQTATMKIINGLSKEQELPFKRIRQFQNGRFDTDHIKYRVAGIKINKDKELERYLKKPKIIKKDKGDKEFKLLAYSRKIKYE